MRPFAIVFGGAVAVIERLSDPQLGVGFPDLTETGVTHDTGQETGDLHMGGNSSLPPEVPTLQFNRD